MSAARRKCFVVMPFTEPWSPYVYHAIRTAFATEEFREDWQVERADECPPVGPLMEEVRHLIKNAALIVADLTDANPNVMYEVGAAHEQHKVVVLIRQPSEHPPVDVSSELRIEYSIEHLPSLENDLSRAVRELIRDGRLGEAREFWRGAADETQISVPWTLCTHSRQHLTREAALALAAVLQSFAPVACPHGGRPEVVLPHEKAEDAYGSDLRNHIAIGGPVKNYAVWRMQTITGLAIPAYFRGPHQEQESPGSTGREPAFDLLWGVVPNQAERTLEAQTGRADGTCIISRVATADRSVFTIQGIHAPVTLWATKASLTDQFWRSVFDECDSLPAYVLDREASCCVVARMPTAGPAGNLKPECLEAVFGRRSADEQWTLLPLREGK